MAGLLLALSACDSSGPVDRPNVLFILADDLRWDALGSYGNDGVRTPNLDRLAAEGAKLANFQVASPVCSPSRANLLTGLYTHDPGIVFFERETRFARPRIRAGTDTIATHLNLAGYVTSFIGKAHLGGDPRHWGFAETPLYQPGFAFGEAPAKHKVLYVDGEKQPLPRETTSRFGDAALALLSERTATGQNEPWFLWLAFAAPHSPYDYDPAFPYREEDLRPPPGYPAEQPLIARHIWRGYYSEISALDEQVGRILDLLDARGVADDTLVIFTSDNGIMLGSHAIREKSIWYEEATRLPALVRWPGHVKPGSTVSAPISTVDVLPTILDAIGRDVPPALRGASFRPALEGGAAARDVTFSEAYREKALGGGTWSMARDARYKLVRVRGTEERFFYDLQEDPHETRDLSGSAEHRAEIERLGARLAAWEQGDR